LRVIKGMYNPDGVNEIHCPYCGEKVDDKYGDRWYCNKCDAYFLDGDRPFIVLVTQGIYSDYRIIGAFSSRYRAYEFLQLYRSAALGCETRIEEYELDVYIENIKTTVTMSENGDVLRIDREYDVKDGFRGFEGKLLVWTIDTTDVVRAVKVVNEKRTIILAHNIWGDDKAVRDLFGGD